MKGLITEIQHASVHDGPGLRSVIFLKGCQMRCFWCHNPEAIQASPQLAFDESKCVGCRRCSRFCTAHGFAGGRHFLDRSRCSSCMKCAGVCWSGALSVCGRQYSMDEVMADIAEDLPFYGESGGGVTISGGEPGMQADFAAAILRRCHEMGIHTAVETNLAYPREICERLLADCDLVMADLKHADERRHREGTGCGNDQVLDNLRAISAPLILRTPLVPGFNDDPETILQIADFAAGLPTLRHYELLSYHPLGCGKAERLGMAERSRPLDALAPEAVRRLVRAAATAVVPLLVNGEMVDK